MDRSIELNITSPLLETICQRPIPAGPQYYPQAEHQGKVLYFCTQACLDAFLLDPERFLIVHSHKAGEPGACP